MKWETGEEFEEEAGLDLVPCLILFELYRPKENHSRPIGLQGRLPTG